MNQKLFVQNICHTIVTVPAPNVPAADIFGTGIFH